MSGEPPSRHPGPGPDRTLANTHLHLPPNFSAFETPEQAVEMAALEGMRALGTSNYYDFRVYRRFADAATAAGIAPLFGLEIITYANDLPEMLFNDPTNPGRMYMSGKALTRFDPPVASAARRMAEVRAASDARMRRMTALVAERFARAGMDDGPTHDQIAAAVAERCGVPVEWVSLQERHIAAAFGDLLFAAVPAEERGAALGRAWGGTVTVDTADRIAVQEAIRANLMKYGKAAFVPEASVSFDDAYRLILELGGIPCYTIVADGADPIGTFEDPPEALAERLADRAIHFAELVPVRNRPEVVDRYVAVLRDAGIVVAAGTEHNTQRMIPLEPAALGGGPLSEGARAAFWEAACVIAAHQELSAAGRPGYVGGDGRLTSGFPDAEERIRWFAEMGEERIAGAVARP
jgi:hypothetical protein